MAQAQIHKVLSVNKDRLYKAITRYENYPQFIDGCHEVKVQRNGGEIRVSYRITVLSQDVTYTLIHKEIPEAGKVQWELVESNFFKKNTGSWEIKEKGKSETDVVYTIDVEFKVPVPGFILNRLVKGSLPGMVKGFEDQANGE